VPAFAQFEAAPNQEIGGKARLVAIDKVARKALWWFRWAALSTFLTGILITIVSKDYFSNGFNKSAGGLAILTGMLLGTIMMLNVWGVIWRNQKVVLANAANVLGGGTPDPAVPGVTRAAGMASRQNTIFSVSMLFFMVYAAHGPYASYTELSSGKMAAWWIIALILIAVLELNALGMMPWKKEANKGLNVLYDGPGVRNPLIAAFGLWAIFLIMSEVLLKI
jgi:uncharacterized membrane protein